MIGKLHVSKFHSVIFTEKECPEVNRPLTSKDAAACKFFNYSFQRVRKQTKYV